MVTDTLKSILEMQPSFLQEQITVLLHPLHF